MSRLLPVWTSLISGHDNVTKISAASPCPIGETFFMLLNFIMTSIEEIRRSGSINMELLLSTLAALIVRVPSFHAAMESTWPVFGLLALAQQRLLRLGIG
eukprot:TRINITY_DN96051_c0_g1_i1.p1 TRINITY_DN96051_c0_g1~~TRINITY_DN96051_c0_g1_i1.p1  ORF type:complete len:100 (-),score=21.34 TRINITY_DN96051_c0_g1_i1:35-334(-)